MKQGTKEGTILSRFTRSNSASFYSNTRIIFSISHILTVATQHGAGVEGCIFTAFSFSPGDAEAHPDNCLSAYTQTNHAYKRGGHQAEKPFFFPCEAPLLMPLQWGLKALVSCSPQ